MQYKVLSLLQPWATLVVLGWKQIETRSWATSHRGPLQIHASLGRDKDGRALAKKLDIAYDELATGDLQEIN